YLGDWRRAAAVFLEPESLSGNPPPRREAGKGVAPTISARPTGGGGLGTDFDLDGGLIVPVAPTLRAGGNQTGGDRPYGTDADTCDSLIPYTLAIRGRDGGPDLECRQDGTANGGRGGLGVRAIAFGWQNSQSQGISASDEITPTLDKSKTPAVAWSIMPQNSGKDYKARQVDVAQPLMAGGPVGGNQGGDYIQQK